MSRLKELLDELCPDGVEYKKLGDIATEFFRGTGIKREQVTEKGTPCVRYGEIYTTYDIWFDTCISHVDEAQLSSKKYFEYGDILFAITGEKVEDIAKSVAYMGHEKCLAGGDIVVMKHKQNPKYLSYALSTENARQQKSKGRVKSKVVHSNVPAIKEIVIPVPPLAVQSEIVRLLDNFTALTAALTAELAARKTQYEHYRDTLLTFDGAPDNAFSNRRSDTVRWLRLGDIALQTCSGGTPLKTHREYYEGGDIPWLRTQEVTFNEITTTSCCITEAGLKNSSAKWIPENCVIIAISGASAGRCAINKIPLTTNQHCLNIEVNPKKALYKYVYYCVQNEYYELLAKKEGARGDLNASRILSLQIPVPPLAEQERIVSLLDRFDALVNDISCGLPAEIEARRKQYEYYRDRLLTFREKRA